MTRRVIFIILAALALALLVGLLWFWFFSGGGAPAPQGGTFGTGQTKTTGTTGGTPGQTNIPSGVTGGGNTSSSGGLQNSSGSGGPFAGGGSVTGAGGVGGVPGVDSAGGVDNVQGTVDSGAQGFDNVDGVDWLGGTVGGAGGVSALGGAGGPTTGFVPKTVGQLNTDSVGGTPGILGSFGATGTGGGNGANLGLAIGGVLGAGVGCALYATFEAAGAADASARGAGSLAGGFVLVYDFNSYQKAATTKYKDVWDCLARTIGRAVIQQMTSSIVNWINSGFNGQPSFVTNFQQYFTNVGDAAAGEFIRGTGLSFLCSPFQLKIRIAIAQSYARRNNAGSCTLTGIIKNYNSFINGNFGQGGWGGLLQLTTVPTNNPYGAYAYAQIGLATAQNNALNNANRNITPGGFISLQKCDSAGQGPNQNGAAPGVSQNCKVVTPGSIIESSLKETLKQPFLANQLAQSFDQIVSALLNQLVTKTLYNGLSTISGQNGYAADYLTPEQQQAQINAQSMLIDMQGRQQVSQQYGAVAQGSIQDIQNAQQQLQSLANCYSVKGKSAEATTTTDALHAFDPQIDAYNNNITRANQSIATLQSLQTQTLNVATPADVSAATAAYQQTISSGMLITAADVTNAQQDRTTLQSNLAGRNQATATALNQCNAQ